MQTKDLNSHMSVNMPITTRYYLSLSEVIAVNDWPEFLHIAEDGLNLLLGRIHYKNLKYSKSQRGDSAFRILDIVTANIGFDLPFLPLSTSYLQY